MHDPDDILDAVEALVCARGAAGVSIRAVSAATGVSNGALYHEFGSRAALLARTWLRAGRRFLACQSALVDAALSRGAGAEALSRGAGADAVAAAADAPVAFADAHPAAAALLLTVRREEVLAADVPDDIAAQLRDLNGELTGLLIRLATAMWDRRDAAAVAVITSCVVDLPTALVLRRNRLADPTARLALRAAVTAVLDVGPPPRRRKPPSDTTTRQSEESS
ncbi:hypothetical protein MBRU_14020 [Mycolicibacterium brumae DSM 44177]|nr:hypothetical protein MBRU_14020 [Mycolicibacterium brumae DSM 44177]